MDKSTVEKMLQEEKILLNYKPLKMNAKDIFKLKGEKNEYFFEYQLGETGTFIIYNKPLIEDAKQKFQTRYKGQYLMRLGLNARPHFCVDTGELCKNHIHVYEGDDVYGQPIINAYSFDEFGEDYFKDLSGLNVMLDFFKLCNIKLEDGVTIQEVI